MQVRQNRMSRPRSSSSVRSVVSTAAAAAAAASSLSGRCVSSTTAATHSGNFLVSRSEHLRGGRVEDAAGCRLVDGCAFVVGGVARGGGVVGGTTGSGHVNCTSGKDIRGGGASTKTCSSSSSTSLPSNSTTAFKESSPLFESGFEHEIDGSEDGSSANTKKGRNVGRRRRSSGDEEMRGTGRQKTFPADNGNKSDRSKRRSYRRRPLKSDVDEDRAGNEKPSPNQKVKIPDDYYEVLGLSRSATDAEIKKAYRRKAVRTHPDKTGGDRKEFDAVSEAYDVLSDATKKSLYDRYGKRGLQNNGVGVGAGVGVDEIFKSFFGGVGGAGGSSFFQNRQESQASPRAHRTVRYQLEVTLEDLYNGSTKGVTIAKPQSAADVFGRRMSSASEKKKVDIVIEPGMKAGQKIVLPGELDYIPGATPGDVIFVLSQSRHSSFSRKNNDLAVEVELTPDEAMNGFCHEIKHLDGRTIVMKSNPDFDGQPPIKDGEVRMLPEEGMPVRDGGRAGRFGDLYVQFKVTMPKEWGNLSSEERKVLGELLNLASTPSEKSSGKERRGSKRTSDASRAKLKERLLKLSMVHGIDTKEGVVIDDNTVEGKNEKNKEKLDSKEERGKKAPFLRAALLSNYGNSHMCDFNPTSSGNDGEHLHFDSDSEGEEGFSYGRSSRFMGGMGDPFQQFRFFPGATGGFGGRGMNRYSFGSVDDEDEDAGYGNPNVQCQQM